MGCVEIIIVKPILVFTDQKQLHAVQLDL